MFQSKKKEQSTSHAIPTYPHPEIKNFNSHLKKLSKSKAKNSKLQKLLSKFQSSSTLQKGISTISFSKAERFPNIRPENQISSLILLPNTLSTRGPSFGFGSKLYIQKHILKNAKEFPSPNSYSVHEELAKGPNSLKGKTFGLSFAHYSKNYIPGDRSPNLEIHKDRPGPGAYLLDRELGDLNIKNKRRVQVLIKGKKKDFIDEIISQNNFQKRYFLSDIDETTRNQRYNSITFGKGTKFDFTLSPTKNNPGPGTYKTFSDVMKKEKKIKMKLFS